jgi:hypothetical protein
MIKLKDILNEASALDRVWTTKFGKETVGQFLTRHKVPKIGNKYILFHARPKGSTYNELRIGTYLEEDPKSAMYFAARDRGLKQKDIELIRLELKPDEIEPGSFMTLRKPIKIIPSMIQK